MLKEYVTENNCLKKLAYTNSVKIHIENPKTN